MKNRIDPKVTVIEFKDCIDELMGCKYAYFLESGIVDENPHK
jgi:hypothetical protein